LTPVHSSYLKQAVTNSQQHTTRLAISWKPGPEEFLTHLQASQFSVREVLFDGFLQENYVDAM
jgi:16S rRNA C1402 (ribose-2'-O) methylase RsmI